MFDHLSPKINFVSFDKLQNTVLRRAVQVKIWEIRCNVNLVSDRVVIPCNRTLLYELKSHINHLLIKNSYLFTATSRNYQSSGLRISELFNIALAVIKIENASRIDVSLINDNHTSCGFYNE